VPAVYSPNGQTSAPPTAVPAATPESIAAPGCATMTDQPPVMGGIPGDGMPGMTRPAPTLIPRQQPNAWDSQIPKRNAFDAPNNAMDPGVSPPNTFWFGADYLLWWTKRGPLTVPLVTTDTSAVLPPLFTAGRLDQPTTAVLFGGNGLNYGNTSGVRATLGGWLNEAQTFGLECSGLLLEQRTAGFSATSDAAGNPVLAVPFFDPREGLQQEAVAYGSYPGVFSGTVFVTSQSRLWGAEVNTLWNCLRSCRFEVNTLVGFRYLNLQENLNLGVNATSLATPPSAAEFDTFQVQNGFYGAQLGAQAEYGLGCFTFNVLAKVALGPNHEALNIAGISSQSVPGTPGVFPGGIFAEPTNIGRHTTNQFAAVPEVQGQIGVDLIPNSVRFVAGYTFLYISDVVRPGNQIDRTVNASQQGGGTLTGPARPAPQFQHSDYLAHGLNFGLQLLW
jgi:hypothetical protein